MVLFKNPVDKQQVMTLSRQMYPDNPQHLMRHFKEATEKTFGYLLIYLKPITSDSLRMRNDMFTNVNKWRQPQDNILFAGISQRKEAS